MQDRLKTRRDFIKNLAVSGTAAYLLTSPWLKVFGEQNTSASANNRINLGVVGTGSRGKQLMRHTLEVAGENNIAITALCDNYDPHLQSASMLCKEQEVSPSLYTDYRVMLEKEKLDAVIIATPLHQHAHITIDFLENGIHVLCEKAMARNLDDIRSMYDAHIRTNKILQIGHQRMFNPSYLEGIQRIHNGELGDVSHIKAYWHRNFDWRRPLPENNKLFDRQINWRLYKEYSAGILTELLSHQIQVANWALQKTPVSVMGTGAIRYFKDGREVDDVIALIYTYEDGTQCVYDSMIWNQKYGIEEIIMGDKGVIEFEVNKQYTLNPPPAPGIQQLINDVEHGIFDNLPIGGASWIPELATNDKGKPIYDGEYADTSLEIEAFAKFIRQGTAPAEITTEGYNASIWSILAEQAIDTGEKLSMPDKYII